MAWTKRYVRADAAGSGDGTTNTNSGANGAFTLAEAITHSTTNTGVKYITVAVGGTFANTTTSRTFSGVATATAPNWWAGCNTAEDDCLTSPTLARPQITFTTGAMSVTGTHQRFSGIDWTGSRTAGVPFAGNAVTILFDDCLFNATGVNANSSAWSTTNAAGCYFLRCGFTATTTATQCVNFSAGTGNNRMAYCWVEGGASGVNGNGANSQDYYRTVFYGSAGVGLTAGSGTRSIRGCVVYNNTSDGIKISGLSLTLDLVDNILASNGGWGINQASGANANIYSAFNSYRTNTSGTITGLGDVPDLFAVTLSADPFVNAAGRDMTLAAASNGKAQGGPLWMVTPAGRGIPSATYNDPGAFQHQDAGGGTTIAGTTLLRGMVG